LSAPLVAHDELATKPSANIAKALQVIDMDSPFPCGARRRKARS
jgi:hypothetical protein